MSPMRAMSNRLIGGWSIVTQATPSRVSTRRHWYPSYAIRSHLDPDALHLRVQIERVARELAPVAALLVAAERRDDVEHVVAVDPHAARAERARHAMCL